MKTQKKSSKLLAMVLSAALFAAYGCGGGGGGGGGEGGGGEPTQMSSPDQAASAVSSSTSVMSMASGMGAMLSGLAVTPGGFGARKFKSAPSSGLAKLDPRLKETFDRMATQLKAPVITNAVMKAKASRAAMAAPVNTPCDSGSYDLTVTDSSDNSFSDITYTYVFNNCRDTVYNEEWTGTLTMRHRQAIDNSSSGTMVTANNFTDTVYYADSNFSVKDFSNVLNATFSDVTNYAATSDSGTFSASGSFAYTIYDGNMVMTFSFNNLRDDWTETYTDSNKWTSLETTDTLNGGVTFSVPSAYPGFEFSLSCANMQDKWQYDPSGTDREWINGRVAIHWTPDVYGCVEGIFDVTTDAAAPLTYTYTDWYCPVSGTLNVNNASIVYGRPIVIKVGSAQVEYADCSALEALGASCTAPTM